MPTLPTTKSQYNPNQPPLLHSANIPPPATILTLVLTPNTQPTTTTTTQRMTCFAAQAMVSAKNLIKYSYPPTRQAKSLQAWSSRRLKTNSCCHPSLFRPLCLTTTFPDLHDHVECPLTPKHWPLPPFRQCSGRLCNACPSRLFRTS
jgi:hypothetical protein